jgi:hypothetical protein
VSRSIPDAEGIVVCDDAPELRYAKGNRPKVFRRDTDVIDREGMDFPEAAARRAIALHVPAIPRHRTANAVACAQSDHAPTVLSDGPLRATPSTIVR